MPDCNIEQVRHVLNRLNSIFVETTKSRIGIQYSAGWTDYIQGESLNDLLKRADDMLYANKRNPKELHGSSIVGE